MTRVRKLTFLVFEAAATEIDDLDGTLRWMTKKDVLTGDIRIDT